LSKTINITGKSPFEGSSGVYEVKIAITADKPSKEKNILENLTSFSLERSF